jgi:hypothetical protein
MHTMSIDKLFIVKKLTLCGFTPQQAEGQAEVFAEVVEKNLVTRDYLDIRFAQLRQDLDVRFASIDARFASIDVRFASIDTRFAELRAEFKQAILEMRNDLLKWLIPLIMGQAGMVVALIKLL